MKKFSPKISKEINKIGKRTEKSLSHIKSVPNQAKSGSSFLQRYAKQSGLYKK